MEAAALRRSETRLAWITLALTAIYIPAEIWVSLPDLTHPFFVIDAVAMVLLVWGALRSLRVRPLLFFSWSLYLVARGE